MDTQDIGRKNTELILNPDGSIYHLGLTPGDLADTVIFVGDPDRVAKVSMHFDHVELERQKREFVTHTGTLNGKRISIISTGISTDNIDIVMNEVDALVNVDFATGTPISHPHSLDIIRLGTSGSISPNVPVDAILVSEHAIGVDGLDRHYPERHLVEPMNWNDIALYLTDATSLPVYVSSCDKGLLRAFERYDRGVTLTCPGFYGPQGRELRIKSRIGSYLRDLHGLALGDTHFTNLEMETAGIYLLGELLGHRAISINAILANRLSGRFSTSPEITVSRMIEDALSVICELD